MENKLKHYREKNVRKLCNADEEEWYFSVEEVVAILKDSENPRRYWSDLKRKLTAEGSELYDKIVQLKMQKSCF